MKKATGRQLISRYLAFLTLALAVLACDSTTSTSVDGSPPPDAKSDVGAAKDLAGDQQQPDPDQQTRQDQQPDQDTADQQPDQQQNQTLCDPAPVTCYSKPTACGIGEIHTIENNCWGSCVKVESCSDVPAKPICDTTQVPCKMMPPTCPDGYVNTKEGSCFGPCVPIGVCYCGPDGPPDPCPEGFVCHNYANRCGPLED